MRVGILSIFSFVVHDKEYRRIIILTIILISIFLAAQDFRAVFFLIGIAYSMKIACNPMLLGLSWIWKSEGGKLFYACLIYLAYNFGVIYANRFMHIYMQSNPSYFADTNTLLIVFGALSFLLLIILCMMTVYLFYKLANLISKFGVGNMLQQISLLGYSEYNFRMEFARLYATGFLVISLVSLFFPIYSVGRILGIETVNFAQIAFVEASFVKNTRTMTRPLSLFDYDDSISPPSQTQTRKLCANLLDNVRIRYIFSDKDDSPFPTRVIVATPISAKFVTSYGEVSWNWSGHNYTFSIDSCNSTHDIS